VFEQVNRLSARLSGRSALGSGEREVGPDVAHGAGELEFGSREADQNCLRVTGFGAMCGGSSRLLRITQTVDDGAISVLRSVARCRNGKSV
jgi:hypothetical protein